MGKQTSYLKMSKKRKKEQDRKQRGSWNGVNPVTRVKESKKVYSRKKVSRWDGNPYETLIFKDEFSRI